MNRKLKKWTQKEESCLKKWFPIEGLTVQERLPRRSKASIKTKALSLGMDFMKESKKRTWTFEEEQLLIKNYNNTVWERSFRIN